MDLSYKINLFLKEKGMSKKFFAEKLIALEPILKSTREVPSASTIYGYLNGSREIKAELLPYTVLIVAHAGVNRVILRHILGVPFEKIFEIEQPYAGVHLLVRNLEKKEWKEALHVKPL